MRTRGDKRRSVEALAWDAWCVYREVKHEKYVARRKEVEKIVKVRCVGGGEGCCVRFKRSPPARLHRRPSVSRVWACRRVGRWLGM